MQEKSSIDYVVVAVFNSMFKQSCMQHTYVDIFSSQGFIFCTRC